MTNAETIFRGRKVNLASLVPFGFVKNRGKFLYSTHIADGSYEVVVTITASGNVSMSLIDVDSKEVLALPKAATNGRNGAQDALQEYDNILHRIAKACFDDEVFTSDTAKQLIRYVRDTYQDELQFLWKRFPYNAVFRRQDNKNWYAALLVIKASKIGLAGDNEIEILDIRVKPERLSDVIDGDRYFPGYHMNKRHWVTARLNGSVPVEELCTRIDESYAIAAKQ